MVGVPPYASFHAAWGLPPEFTIPWFLEGKMAWAGLLKRWCKAGREPHLLFFTGNLGPFQIEFCPHIFLFLNLIADRVYPPLLEIRCNSTLQRINYHRGTERELSLTGCYVRKRNIREVKWLSHQDVLQDPNPPSPSKDTKGHLQDTYTWHGSCTLCQQ